MQRKIALTIDLEGSLTKLPDRVGFFLELFSRTEVKATFFVLGRLAERAPEVIRRFSQAGHEIGFHGYEHLPICELNRRNFVSELRDWRRRMEDLTQTSVEGYRAPYFSVVRSTAWALCEIATAGFTYDSSIYPGISDRFGWLSAPRVPVQVHGQKLVEFPVPVLAGWLPIGFSGGGYLRLLPWLAVSWGFRRQIQRNLPGMIYVHPWEIDSNPSTISHRERGNCWRGWRESVPGKWGRRRMRERFELLVTTNRRRIAPMKEVISGLADLPVWNSNVTSRV